VGRVISSIIEESNRIGNGIIHSVACLERPINQQFITKIQKSGGNVLIEPSYEDLLQHIRIADIVQIEWWHHPVMARFLCSSELPSARWVIWSHVSGLCPPVIPPALLSIPNLFLFSSPCSWEHPKLAAQKRLLRKHVDVVFSSGGFNDLPLPPVRLYKEPLRFGFVGSLNFSKLHPHFLDYIKAIHQDDFKLVMIGDKYGGEALIKEVIRVGLDRRLEFLGYQTDIGSALSEFDVLVYLLNPIHYGTTENALLEAMALGVVPIVMNNPAERYLVEHKKTGMVVNDPNSFAEAVDWLVENPTELKHIAQNAASKARDAFSISRTTSQLTIHYQTVAQQNKIIGDFRTVFGVSPADWFLACQEDKWLTTIFKDGYSNPDLKISIPHYLFENNKGSVLHYAKTFSDDKYLQRLAQQLANHAVNC